MTTIQQQLRDVRRRLARVSEEADSEARIILAHLYGTSPGGLIMRLLHEADDQGEVELILRGRLEGAPLAYVLHSAPFYGRDYYVDERVLIPRLDTECVAEKALTEISRRSYSTAADICCGSGCIGITLLAETPLEHVTFSDISAGALEVARRNARAITGEARAGFCRADLFAGLTAPADLIVINPPYITEEEYEGLERQIRDYEPPAALLGGRDGLDFYRRLAREGTRHLNAGGMMLAEIGARQADAVRALFAQAGLENIQAGTDLAGRPRWVCGIKS